MDPVNNKRGPFLNRLRSRRQCLTVLDLEAQDRPDARKRYNVDHDRRQTREVAALEFLDHNRVKHDH